MIKSVRLSEYRGVLSGELKELKPLTVLVGHNGCGKTLLLEAINTALQGKPRPRKGERDGEIVVEYTDGERRVLEAGVNASDQITPEWKTSGTRKENSVLFRAGPDRLGWTNPSWTQT